MASLGRLTIDLVASLGGFETDLARASRTTQREMNKVSRQLRFAQRDADMAAQRFRNLSLQMAAIAGVTLGIVVREFRNLSREADRIQKLGIATGLTAEAVQELGFAAEQSGANLESVVKGVQQLQRNIVQANDGLATYVRAFDRVGLSSKELINLAPEEQFRRVAQALAEVDDPAVRTATAMELLGRAGRELLPLLSQGEAGIERFANQLRRTGAVMSQETVDAAARFNDALNLLQRNVQAVRVRLFADLIEPLANVADFLANTERGTEIVSRAFESLRRAVIVLGAAIAGRFVIALGAASIQLAGALIRVAQLAAAKAALTGSTIAATGAVTAFGRAFAVAFGPIGIAAAVLGTLFFSFRDLIPELREAASGLGTFNDEAERLLNVSRLGALEPLISAFTRGAAEIVLLNQQIAETRALVEDPDAFRLPGQPSLSPDIRAGLIEQAKRDLEALEAQLERTTGNTAELSQAIEDAQARLEGLGETADDSSKDFDTLLSSLETLEAQLRGPVASAQLEFQRAVEKAAETFGRGTPEFERALTAYREQLRRAIDQTEEYNDQLDDLEAALRGPMARAQLQFNRRIAEATRLFGQGSIGLSELVRTYALAARELASATQDVTQAFADFESQLALTAAMAELTVEEQRHVRRELAALDAVQTGVTLAMEAGIDVTDEMIRKLRELGLAAFDASQGVNAIRIEQTLGRNLAQAIVQGANLGDAIGRAFRASGSEVLANEMEDAFTGALEKAFQNFKFSDDPQVMQNVTAGFALAIGNAIGGNFVQGALTAAGTVIGAVLGKGLGASIGATIGSFIGGLFGREKDPKIQLAGSPEAFFQDAGKNIRETFDTVFGEISAAFKRFGEDTKQVRDEIVRSIRQFDIAIAGAVRDAAQRDEISQALRDFAIDTADTAGGISLEEILRARFDLILGTFDQFIQDIVRQGFTLEEQAQRLGDILGIERIIAEGEGFAGLERTVEILEQLGFVGETLGETFNRLNQAFNEYANIVVGLEQEIQTSGLNDFQKELVRIQQQLLRNIDSLNKTARAAGLQAAREEDLARAHEAAAIAASRAIARLEESTRRLVADVFGTPLTRIEDQIRALEESAQTAAGGISNLQSQLEQLARFADSLLVGQFSPLPTGPRLEEAMRLLREASGRGDVGAVQQFASQALQIAQSRFGSGQPFVDIFNEVQKIIRGTQPRETVQSVSVVSSPALVALFAERDALLAEQQERERRAMSLDIAQAVADISQATGDAFMDVATRLGFDLEELGQILGFDAAELEDFLRGLQIDPDDIAFHLDVLGTRIVTAIVEDLPKSLRQEPPVGDFPPGEPPPDEPPDLSPIIRPAEETRDAVIAGSEDIVRQLRDSDRSAEVVDLLRRVADGIEREPRNTRTRMART